MVGVPGRSKACSTCKRRKFGCDQQRPSCGQCLKSGLQCGGYARSPIFINSGQQHADAATLSFVPATYVSPSPREQCPNTSLREKKTRPESRPKRGIKTRSCSPNSQAIIVSPSPSPSPSYSIDFSLNRAATESLYLDTFWAKFLPNGKSFSTEAAQYSTAGWTTTIQELGQQHGLVRMALLANAMSVVGSASGQKSLVLEGWGAYTQAMLKLARLLPVMESESTAKVMATSLLLAHYEVMQKPDSLPSRTPALAWLRHATGGRAILLSNRPEAYMEGPAHSLFVDSRLPLMYVDLARRTPCPINTPEWKTIPWTLIPKTPKDKVVDILLNVPAVLSDLEDLFLSGSENGRIHQRQQLETKCRELDAELQAWECSSGFATMMFADFCISPNTPQGRDSLSTEEFGMAHLALVYWTTCNLVYHTLWFLLKDQGVPIPERVHPRQYCRKVALLVSYVQSRDVGLFFFNMAAFPVAVAVGFLAREDPRGQPSEEFKQLVRCLEQGKHGSQVMKFLGAWPWNTDREKKMMKFDPQSLG